MLSAIDKMSILKIIFVLILIAFAPFQWMLYTDCYLLLVGSKQRGNHSLYIAFICLHLRLAYVMKMGTDAIILWCNNVKCRCEFKAFPRLSICQSWRQIDSPPIWILEVSMHLSSGVQNISIHFRIVEFYVRPV